MFRKHHQIDIYVMPKQAKMMLFIDSDLRKKKFGFWFVRDRRLHTIFQNGK